MLYSILSVLSIDYNNCVDVLAMLSAVLLSFSFRVLGFERGSEE